MSSCTFLAAEKLQRFELIRESFLSQAGLPFDEALPEELIERAADEEGIDFGGFSVDQPEVIYTPAVTLWAFLSQMLHANEQRSCLAAVARVAVLLASREKMICASNSGAYCRARAKLTEAFLKRLLCEMAERCEAEIPEEWRWRERRVLIGDGTTISLPDTKKNQASYPQSNSQEPGLGFPLLRLVGVFSLATGLLQEVAMGPYAGKETGETALLREIFGAFKKGDVFLADRYYCGWFLIALLQELGVDVVMRLHHLRDADFQKGGRLGKGDHFVEWPRLQRPDWMDEATYARMPKSLRIREVEVQVKEKGFRVRSLVVVTTLLNAESYSKEDLAALYRQRWLVELDLRTVKSTLHLDILRCQTPEMARKELYTGLLAYNLIRQTMLRAALQAECSPRELSFTAAMQTIATSWLVAVISEEHHELLLAMQVKHLAAHRVGNRPNRIEPRAIKRRPKPHDLLMEPRKQARAKLLNAAST